MEVQSVLLNKTHTKKQKLFFTYRGFLKCVCGCVYTASNKKGYDYYYCTNGKGNCEAHKKYLKSGHIGKLTSGIFDKIKFDEEIIKIAHKASEEKYLKHTKGLNSLRKSRERYLWH